MSDETSVQSRQGTHAGIESIPVDIVAGWGLLAAAYLVGVFFPESPLRTVVAAPVLFFLPGYVLVAAAFPHRGTVPKAVYPNRIGVGERFALSFGLSIVVLPFLGLVVGALPREITLPVLTAVLGAFIVVVGVVAGFRRHRLPREYRFRIPVRRWTGYFGDSLRRGSAAERLVTVALCCSIVLAVGVAGYALAVPNDGESFTDFHLVTEDDGELVAADYPTELTEGEPAAFTVGIQNHEGEPTDYVVVVTLDRVADTDDGQRVVESDELARMDATVEPGEHWTETHTVTPRLVGEDLRLTYHLYVDDAPENVDRESAYRHLHLWVDVEV